MSDVSVLIELWEVEVGWDHVDFVEVSYDRIDHFWLLLQLLLRNYGPKVPLHLPNTFVLMFALKPTNFCFHRVSLDLKLGFENVFNLPFMPFALLEVEAHLAIVEA